MSLPLARPFGCLSFHERRSRAAELTAPQDTTTMSADRRIVSPSFSTTTPVTVLPVGSVSSRATYAVVIRLTLGWVRAGSTPHTCASALASTRQGNPSQVLHRMHLLCR